MASQLGQDRLALELLGGLRGGFFLDSGAANGTDSSNTLLLEAEYGWSGICVEPNPAMYRDLIRARRCRCLNVCLYDADGEVDFLEAGFLGGIRETYNEQLLRVVADRWPREIPTVRRPARTIRSVLRECGAPRVIDYWSLDTEGSELALLRSFPFDEYAFRVLTVEHNRMPVRDDIRRLLESRGYRLVRTLDIDDCYLHSATTAPAAWRSAAWHRRRA